jgi:hypothetical protein
MAQIREDTSAGEDGYEYFGSSAFRSRPTWEERDGVRAQNIEETSFKCGGKGEVEVVEILVSRQSS